MASIIDEILYLAFRFLVVIVNLIPLNSRIVLIELLMEIVTACQPRYKKIARRNLERAFPDKDRNWREAIIKECQRAHARLIVDFMRLDKFTLEELDSNIDFAFKERLLALVKQQRPIIFATGHLGSFELLAHYLALIGVPLAFVARQLRPPKLDKWWTARREANGNSVIERSGALKGTFRFLKQGKAVGVLFDQNITRQHAVFIDWFGYPAATSKLVGIAAVRTNAVVVVISIKHISNTLYKISAVEKEFTGIYQNESLALEQKIYEITKDISSEYELMIRDNPREWFWMHRRWRTAPTAEQENFYDNLN